MITYYCSNHRITKYSNELTECGLTKKKSFCSARIAYYKSRKSYFLDWGHSSLYKREQLSKYENYEDIDEEINNYKNLRTALNKYLNSYPIISLKDFKINTFKLYNEKYYTFTIKKQAFKNIYYTWKNKSNYFTKYTALKNYLTLNEENFLRD